MNRPLLLALGLCVFAGSAMSNARGAGFAEVVAANFKTWDTNKDGNLSIAELDVLSANPKIKGEEAAAVGAIKNVVLGARFDLQSVNPSSINQAIAATRGKGPNAAAVKVPDWELAYEQALARTKRAGSPLFAPRAPQVKAVRMGEYGNRAFILLMGLDLIEDAGAVTKMITALPDGKYRVVFEGGESPDLAPLTESELAMSSTSLESGMWAAVLEKGADAIRQERFPQRNKENAENYQSRVARLNTMLQLWRSSKTMEIAFRKETGEIANGRRKMTLNGTPDSLAASLRPQLKQALSKKKAVILVSTGNALPANASTIGNVGVDMPPGLGGSLYPIIGFEDASDSAVIWNPVGGDFSPPGNRGMQNGYAMKDGVMRVPLKELVLLFPAIQVETDVKVNAPGSQSPARKR